MIKNISLSIVVITKNEEKNIGACLNALPDGVEIIVLDSESSDRTVEIAKSYGAKTYTRPFDNYASQKNAAVNMATQDWIFSLDADEIMDEALRQSLISCVATAQKHSAFRVKRSLVYMNCKLRFGKTQDHPIRFFKKNKARFVGDIHEKLQVDGSIGTLSGELLHYSYENLEAYFNRFNQYTSAIAVNHFKHKRTVFIPLHIMRPWFEFIYRYFFLLGCLDGLPGYSYALISSLYTFVKYEKLRELYLEKRNHHVS